MRLARSIRRGSKPQAARNFKNPAAETAVEAVFSSGWNQTASQSMSAAVDNRPLDRFCRFVDQRKRRHRARNDAKRRRHQLRLCRTRAAPSTSAALAEPTISTRVSQCATARNSRSFLSLRKRFFECPPGHCSLQPPAFLDGEDRRVIDGPWATPVRSRRAKRSARAAGFRASHFRRVRLCSRGNAGDR